MGRTALISTAFSGRGLQAFSQRFAVFSPLVRARLDGLQGLAG
jgi:hypothetical protein